MTASLSFLLQQTDNEEIRLTDMKVRQGSAMPMLQKDKSCRWVDFLQWLQRSGFISLSLILGLFSTVGLGI